MAAGPGRYDEACTAARVSTGGRVVLLIVVDGIHGDGFSVQADGGALVGLPAMLRTVADQIDLDR